MDTFPIKKRGQAFALYGMAAVAAPAIGPTLGGWITDNYNWHWIFFINLPFGLLSLWLSYRMVEDPPEVIQRTKRRDPVDFVGLAAVAVGVGLLEFTLDNGQQKDWFGSGEIQLTALLAICALIFFIFWEWNHPDAIIDLKLLKNRNFGTAVFLQLILGAMLYGSTILIPQYLQTLLGYTAERAGMALSPAGVVMMVMMVVAGITAGKGDPRLTVMLGYLAVAAGLYNYTRLDLYTSYGTVTVWRMLQVIGLPFIFIPIGMLNYVGVPRDKSNQVSSLSNFARNMGGSAGTALLTTFLARSQQVQQTTLVRPPDSQLVCADVPDQPLRCPDACERSSSSRTCHGANLRTVTTAGGHACLSEHLCGAIVHCGRAIASGVDHAITSQAGQGGPGTDGRALEAVLNTIIDAPISMARLR